MRTEYVVDGFVWKDKKATIYTDVVKPDGSIVYERVSGFKPYFYVPNVVEIPKNEGRIFGVEPGYTDIFGKKVKKVFTRLPGDVRSVREQFFKYYEADVLFDWRYRIDEGFVIKKNNKFYIDIECAMGSKFIKGDYSYPITCLTCYDTNSKQYNVYAFRSDLKKEIKEEQVDCRIDNKDYDKVIKYRLHTFSKESDMLLAFCSHFITTNPDVLTAWNTSFDYPYLINRMSELSLNPAILSPIKFVSIDEYSGEARIKGRYVLDLLKAYRKIHIGQLDSFKLDDVGTFEFGVAKVKLDLTFTELWKKDIKTLIRYNIADLEICIELDKKRGIIEFFEGISNFTGAPLDTTLQNSRVLDFYFLSKAHERGIVLPSADRSLDPPEFEGAIVKEPVKGLHKNVACLDLTALYPSIIMAGNMSLETIDPDGDIKFGNGISFKSSPGGFISGLIQGFWIGVS